MPSLNEKSIADLSARFSGVLLRPGESGYDDARKIHNGMIDRNPALIARCVGTADIVDSVNFARTQGLELAVRGGGHNVAGRAVCDDGLMLDLSLMKGIHVDPVRRTARAQGGVTWREFNRETQAHGLATTGGVISTTGIAGLTLGGGLGWLMAKYGLAMDNLLSAEVVTAAGEILAKAVIPVDQLVRKADDEQEGTTFRVTGRLILDLYAVGFYFRHIHLLQGFFIRRSRVSGRKYSPGRRLRATGQEGNEGDCRAGGAEKPIGSSHGCPSTFL